MRKNCLILGTIDYEYRILDDRRVRPTTTERRKLRWTAEITAQFRLNHVPRTKNRVTETTVEELTPIVLCSLLQRNTNNLFRTATINVRLKHE